jgi:alginate O-acetyltransferase complex protein AlgI
MSFDSLSFWFIFLLTLATYWRLSFRIQNYLLLVLSLFFYSIWSLKFTAILVFSSFIDFIVAQQMQKTSDDRKRKFLLSISLTANLGLLFFFKYYLYLVNEGFLATLNMPKLETIYKWGLPIGISFYTFQILSYTIDVYRKRVKATNSFFDFMLFVTFFPQLVAGPIEKARALLPQIQRERNYENAQVEQGLYLCLWGLFKKFFVASSLALPIENYLYQSQSTEVWAVLSIGLLTTIMVYADFSAYSDMARGMAMTLGFKLVINFKPFWLAKSPPEFWEKWNLSLTHWVRDYVVLPLRGDKNNHLAESLKILFVMVLIGLWHAPKINWLFFGLFNGFLIVLYNYFLRFKFFPTFLGWALLLMLYVGSGLLHSLPDIASIQKALSSIDKVGSFAATWDLWRYSLFFIIPMVALESFNVFHKTENNIFISKIQYKVAFVILCLTGIVLLERTAGTGFIYFQF